MSTLDAMLTEQRERHGRNLQAHYSRLGLSFHVNGTFKGTSRRVRVNGTDYANCFHASTALGISEQSVQAVAHGRRQHPAITSIEFLDPPRHLRRQLAARARGGQHGQ